MSLKSFGGLLRFPRQITESNGVMSFSAANNLNAAGVKLHCVGQVVLENPLGGSKTISAAGGGKIAWRSGSAITFANNGTILRLGIQDLDPSASISQGDNTFDVYSDLVGGVDTININTNYRTTMESGSKTINHGDWIAIAVEMTARAGADSVVITSAYGGIDTAPYAGLVFNGGGSMAAVNGNPCFVIVFDDGTLGWLPETILPAGASSVGFNMGTAGADEYGNLITLPFSAIAAGVEAALTASNSSADFEVLLYANPLGTPSVIAIASIDGNHLISSGIHRFIFSSPVRVAANTAYAIAIRPTTANDITLQYITSDALLTTFKPLMLGENYSVKRLDNTGSFSSFDSGTAKNRIMQISLLIDKLDVNAGQATSKLGI